MRSGSLSRKICRLEASGAAEDIAVTIRCYEVMCGGLLSKRYYHSDKNDSLWLDNWMSMQR